MRRWLPIALLAAVAVLGAWWWLRPASIGDGFASGNGRIEATEIDVATKIPGRIAEILVDEGDFVHAGDVFVRMDVAMLVVQRKEAEAQLQQARIGVDTAKSLVTQREAEKAAAVALMAQCQA